MVSRWRSSLLSNTTARMLVVPLLALLFVISYESSPSVVSAASWTDCSQALYVAMEGNGGGGADVYRYDCNGNEIDRYATGFTGTSGLTIDAAGNMYISDDSPGIWRVTPAGVVTPIAANVSFQNPNALFLDSAGRLLVADSGNSVLRITLAADGSASTTEILAQGFSIPQGVIESSTGTVLFTDSTGYIWRVGSTTTVPLSSPATADRFYPAQIASGNQGNIAQDSSGNIYISDFGDRIIRISPDGSTAKDVVDIDPTTTCPSGQSGGTSPGFRGMVFTPDNNSLVATGYCKDNIYVFSKADLDSAWTSGTPIKTLPTPFVQNPSGALDMNINGPFGIAFFAATAEKPHIRSCVLPAKAPTFWVDGTYTGATSTGSSSQPFKKIMDAVNNVSTGTESIIKVKPGTYAEHVDVRKPRVHLRGEGPGSTIVDAGAAGANGFTYGADGITIGNFRVVNGGSLNSGIGVFGPSKPVDVEICNNVFTGNAKAVGTGNSSPLIVNNTFYNNTLGVSLAGGSTSTTIRNNIFQGGATTTFGTGIDAFSGSASTIDHNLFYNLINNFTGAGSPSCTVGCIFSQNPQLNNPTGGDFHLKAGSPAIDKGTSIGAPINDFENDARPKDGDGNGSMIHDMGADEAKSASGTIKGQKFNDLNGNGKLDSGEPGLAGWVIYHDANNNRTLDSGEIATTTDSGGNYALIGIPAGLQYIREQQQSGWKQTAPPRFGAMMTGGSEVPSTTSTASGWASIDFNASTSKLFFDVSWMGVQGGTTTGLHIHEGSASSTGPVVVDLAAAAGASSTAFASPVVGITTVSTTTASALMSGNLYVNLHSAGFPSGEMRGQIMDTGRALVENIPVGGVVSGRNFGNMKVTVPPEGEPVDECSCMIGIFEGDNTHDWELVWVGSATTTTITTKLKVAAVSVNSAESGTIVVKIKDEGSSTTTITVAHPTVEGTANTVEQSLTLVPGKRYAFTVEHTGTAHHYKLGSKDHNLAIGQAEVRYLEAGTQDWMMNVGAGETVKLTMTTDSSNLGANQASAYRLTVRNASGTVVFTGATTTISVDTPQTVTIGTSSSSDRWIVRLEAINGHIRMTKDTGADRNFYVMPCPKQGPPQEPGGGPPTPVPGVGTWGLVMMTGLLGAAFVWTARRKRRPAAQG